MPDLRRDPVVGRWVIISTERAGRPRDFFHVEPTRPSSAGLCPFCPGQEHLTPREVLAYRSQGGEANSPGWTVRVVPNKFPALQVEGDLGRVGVGLYDRMNGLGAHEVIIETADHKDTLADLPSKRIEDVLWAYRDRVVDLKRDLRFKYILVFKNHGAPAGATLEHEHSQLIALPIVPNLVREEIEGARQHFVLKERCVFCDIVRQELSVGRRVLMESGDIVALAPYASRFPFETWFLPRQHGARFEDAPRQQYESLARALKIVLMRIDRALESP